MTVDLFEQYDKKLIAYEWIVDYPSGAYDFIFELIEENKKLKKENKILKDSNNLIMNILTVKKK